MNRSLNIQAERQALAPVPALTSSNLLQRKCACGQHTIAGGECSECGKNRQTLQRVTRNSDLETRNSGGVPSIVNEVLNSPGQPLDAATRAFMEPRFGHDFSRVRIHTDARAAESASEINALAYTVGRQIVFDSGQYMPGTSSGRQVLAHELTHVVQQSDGDGSDGVVRMQISSPAEPHEREAERVADAVTDESAGQERWADSTQISSRSAMRLQRLIRQSLVNCPAGQNPFNADKRAVALLDNAVAVITRAEAARAANPADPDVVAVGNALRQIFHLDPANVDTWTLGAPQVRLPVIKRRIEAVRDYISSVVFTINCCTLGGACPATCGTCAGTENAFVCGGETSTITLCPPFWALPSLNERGRSYAHEVFHITFGFIEDWTQPNAHNAHCYAHFTALLNGFEPEATRRCH